MMKNNIVSRNFTYKLKRSMLIILFLMVNFLSEMLAAQARPQQSSPQGIFQRFIKIKYATELYLITAAKQSAAKHSAGNKKEMDINIPSIQYESLDSALAIYNTIRWNMDGLVYQLSGDLVAANSPKKLRLLNDWCLSNELAAKEAGLIEGNYRNKRASVHKKLQPYIEALEYLERYCREFLPGFSPIGKNVGDQNQFQNKNINLTTNVFYLIKDSYSLIKGLSEIKTQKTTALVEILDQMRLASPQEILKQVK